MRLEAGEFVRYLAKVRASDILMPFLQYMMNYFDCYNAQDSAQRDYMVKEWQMFTLELLSPNMLSKENIRTTVVSDDNDDDDDDKWWCDLSIYLSIDIFIPFYFSYPHLWIFDI